MAEAYGRKDTGEANKVAAYRDRRDLAARYGVSTKTLRRWHNEILLQIRTECIAAQLIPGSTQDGAWGPAFQKLAALAKKVRPEHLLFYGTTRALCIDLKKEGERPPRTIGYDPTKGFFTLEWDEKRYTVVSDKRVRAEEGDRQWSFKL